MSRRSAALGISLLFLALPALAQRSKTHDPTWWDKYQYILNNGPDAGGGTSGSVSFGSNVDVSNECGPQSETYITVDTSSPKRLAGIVACPSSPKLQRELPTST